MDIEIRKFVDDNAGIYYFKNTLNNKYYIGQAVNIRKRLQAHVGNCNNSRYDNPLYRAIHKYGWETFEFGILRRVDKEEMFLKEILDFWERYYIVLYNSYASTGYNQTIGGDAGILGFKMNEAQCARISKNAKKIMNDGRNVIYCYDIEKNEVTQHTSLVSLSKYLEIKLSTGSIRNLLVNNRYLISRTLEEIEIKKQKYNTIIRNFDCSANRDYHGRFPKKITTEAIGDIINGMSQKEWTLKYNLCKASYSQTKRRLVKEGKMHFTRVYTKKVSKDDFLEYMKSHSAKEAAEYFDVNISRIYKYNKAYK